MLHQHTVLIVIVCLASHLVHSYESLLSSSSTTRHRQQQQDASVNHNNIFRRRSDDDVASDDSSHVLLPSTSHEENHGDVQPPVVEIETLEMNSGFVRTGITDIIGTERRNLKGAWNGMMTSTTGLLYRNTRPAEQSLRTRHQRMKRKEEEEHDEDSTKPDAKEQNRPCDDDDMTDFFTNMWMSMKITKFPTPSPANAPLPDTSAPAPTTKSPIAKPPPPPIPTKKPTPPISPPQRPPTTKRPVAAPPTKAPLAPASSPTKKPTLKPTVPETMTDHPSFAPTGAQIITTIGPTITLVCTPQIDTRQRQSEILDILVTVTPEDTILQTGSSQNMAYLWLINDDAAQVCPENELDVIQRYVMAVNYFSLGGEEWNECSSSVINGTSSSPCINTESRHLSGDNVCDWFNVTCSVNNTVITSIILEDNNLVGTLPAELSALSRLETLGYNNNPGIIGSIPTSYGAITTLKHFDLNSSTLGGTIPTTFFCGDGVTQLERFDVLSSNLTGTLSTCIGQLTELNTFVIDQNMFSGTLPTQIGQLSSLEYLTVNINQLTGPIPSEIGNASNLKVISVQENSFTGTIPTTIGTMTQIETLNFFMNQLSGTIPSELGNLRQMQNLFLHFNNFTGTMPIEICNLLLAKGSSNGTTTGRIQQLTADCGPSGKVICPRDCCTACF